MPISPTGQIIDQYGNPTGGSVNLSTGQMITPNATSPIAPISTGSLITPAQPLSVAPVTPVAMPNVQNIDITQPKPVEPAKAPQPDYVKTIEDLTTAFIGKPEVTAGRIETETLNYNQQLNDIVKQINLEKANILSEEERIAGAGTTGAYAAVESQKARRTSSIKLMGLAAVGEFLQGNIALAKTHAENAVNAEFAQKEKDLLVARQNIMNNYDKMTSEQQKRADAALLKLDKEDAFVKQQSDDKKTIQGIALQAAQNGASSDTINKILSSSDLKSALGTSSGYLAKETEGSIQRYQFARKGGYADSYTDYLNYEENVKAKAKLTQDSISNAVSVAEGIISGTIPPDLTKNVSFRDRTAVVAELQRKGYDLTKATQDWAATQKYLSTLNSVQQVRLRQAVDFAYESLDIVDDLNDEASKILARKGINIINKTEIAAARQGLYGEEARSVATRLDNQISDLISELATVYKGGNSSTDETLKLASKQLSSDWSAKVLTDNVNLIRKNLLIRQNSINNAGVAGISNNNYNPELGNMETDINSAVHDPLHFKTREELLDAIIKEYGISKEEAWSKIISIWKDNITR